ncbi:hypothetical protein DM02DRAFT_651227 [Periconia macrospinosa]|uniref:Uncharacterized protein n=1 Tax=Periconia macrospinosa TaxID=97972 RepID=A0A2V1E2M3_9PLEO|nr:hypothetical protein DM02DRAFT_651227 [Periconia macrospinosa]
MDPIGSDNQVSHLSPAILEFNNPCLRTIIQDQRDRLFLAVSTVDGFPVFEAHALGLRKVEAKVFRAMAPLGAQFSATPVLATTLGLSKIWFLLVSLILDSLGFDVVVKDGTDFDVVAGLVERDGCRDAGRLTINTCPIVWRKLTIFQDQPQQNGHTALQQRKIREPPVDALKNAGGVFNGQSILFIILGTSAEADELVDFRISDDETAEISASL